MYGSPGVGPRDKIPHSRHSLWPCRHFAKSTRIALVTGGSKMPDNTERIRQGKAAWARLHVTPDPPKVYFVQRIGRRPRARATVKSGERFGRPRRPPLVMNGRW